MGYQLEPRRLPLPLRCLPVMLSSIEVLAFNMNSSLINRIQVSIKFFNRIKRDTVTLLTRSRRDHRPRLCHSGHLHLAGRLQEQVVAAAGLN